MTAISRFLARFTSVFVVIGSVVLAHGVNAMSLEERGALDLSAYTVTDPDAGYFDVAARRAFLKSTTSPILTALATKLKLGFSCRRALEMPVMSDMLTIPRFYVDNDGWRLIAKPFLVFDDTVADFAAAHLVADDRYHADCLVDFLKIWAEDGAFLSYVFDQARPQAWFQIESSLFAAALAYSVVRADVKDRPDDLAVVEDWLTKVAQKHLSLKIEDSSTCCNNHFYRRALYATMIGVLTQTDDLFQIGVSAIYSATDDGGASGALPLEMERGALAAHYNNFSVMYLALIAQIIERQGYPIFDLEFKGAKFADVISFNLAMLEDVTVLEGHAEVALQQLKFMSDDQYFAWLEAYVSRFGDPSAAALIADRRPLRNRSAGGYMTLYFYTPKQD